MMAHYIKSGLECSVEMVNKRYGHPIVYLRIPQIAATPGLVNFILGKIECLHFSVAYKKRVGSHNGSKHRQWLVVHCHREVRYARMCTVQVKRIHIHRRISLKTHKDGPFFSRVIVCVIHVHIRCPVFSPTQRKHLTPHMNIGFHKRKKLVSACVIYSIVCKGRDKRHRKPA